MEIIKEVYELAENMPLRYEQVLYCYMENNQNIKATKKELEKYVMGGY